MNEFDSKEEEAFSMWLKEAFENDLIGSSNYHRKSYEIFPKKTINVIKKLKTKSKMVEKTLLQPLTYTPDFEFYGDKKVFESYKLHPSKYEHKGSSYYFIDVKGGFSRHGDGKQFSIIQKAMYDKLNIYVNKLVPFKFFKLSWLPEPVKDKDCPVWCNAKPGEARKKRSMYKNCLTLKEQKEDQLL